MPLTVEDLVVNPRFESLFGDDRHTPEQYAELENLVLSNGYAPLEHWHGMLIEGHTRYSIWEKHHKGKPDAPDVPLRELHFKDESEAEAYIIKQQLSRRNLSEKRRKYYRGLLSKTVETPSSNGKPEGFERDGKKGGKKYKKGSSKLSKSLGINRSTLHRDEKFAEAVDSLVRRDVSTKADLLDGNVKTETVVKAAMSPSNSDAKRILEGNKPPAQPTGLSETGKRFAAPLRMLQKLNEEFPWSKFKAIEAEIRKWSDEACKA